MARCAPERTGAGIPLAELYVGRRFDLKLEPQGTPGRPADYTRVGQSLPRPDIPARCRGAIFTSTTSACPACCTPASIRRPRFGRPAHRRRVASPTYPGRARCASLISSGVAATSGGAQGGRRDSRPRGRTRAVLPDRDAARRLEARGPVHARRDPDWRGSPPAASERRRGARATYSGRSRRTAPSARRARWRMSARTTPVWTASQATHRSAYVREICPAPPGQGARDLPRRRGLLWHERPRGRRRRSRAPVQDGRPAGPANGAGTTNMAGTRRVRRSCSISPVTSMENGRVHAWQTEMWVPGATKRPPNMPLLAPAAAGLAQPQGLSTGLVSQNGDPPYAGEAERRRALAQGRPAAPLQHPRARQGRELVRGRELHGRAGPRGHDPITFRLPDLSNPRGIEVVKRAAA